MNDHHPSNPFSTRFVRPGSLPYLFPGPRGVERLVERLRDCQWWGQIVGPHGSGKSTLLHTLVPQLERAGREIHWFTLSARDRRLPSSVRDAMARANRATQVIVDGYEQLSTFHRIRLCHRCRRSRAGLLVTTHQNGRLPTLVELQCSVETVQRLVERLLDNGPKRVRPTDVSRCFETQQGNVREVFFALYDLYERRRHDS